LIGNKADLEDQRVIRKEQGEKMKRDYGFDIFMETSAKTGFNAQNLFIEASRLLYDQHVRNRDRYTGTSVSFENFPDKDKFKNLPYDDTDESSQKRKKGCC
jgi:GTPase SAR1 family protein